MTNPKPHTLSEDERRQAVDAYRKHHKVPDYWTEEVICAAHPPGSLDSWISSWEIATRAAIQLAMDKCLEVSRRPNCNECGGCAADECYQELDALLSAHSAAETLAAKPKTGEST